MDCCPITKRFTQLIVSRQARTAGRAARQRQEKRGEKGQRGGLRGNLERYISETSCRVAGSCIGLKLHPVSDAPCLCRGEDHAPPNQQRVRRWVTGESRARVRLLKEHRPRVVPDDPQAELRHHEAGREIVRPGTGDGQRKRLRGLEPKLSLRVGPSRTGGCPDRHLVGLDQERPEHFSPSEVDRAGTDRITDLRGKRTLAGILDGFPVVNVVTNWRVNADAGSPSENRDGIAMQDGGSRRTPSRCRSP